jgi:4'-phosphopantetheinyl transferase
MLDYHDLNYYRFDESNFNLEGENILVIGKSFNSEEFNKTLHQSNFEKAKRFFREEDRIAYLSRHNSLNLILANYINCDPQSILIEKNEYGKPFLKDNPFYFNLSKSKEFFCILFSNMECGVDIEVIRDVSSMKVVAELHFHPAEKMYCETKEFNESFLTVWTRKEALLKAVGTGLANDLSKINTLVDSIKLNDLNFQINTEKYNQFIISACFQGESQFSTQKFKL